MIGTKACSQQWRRRSMNVHNSSLRFWMPMFHQQSGWTYLRIMTRDIRTNYRCSDTAFSSTFSTLSSSQSKSLSTKSNIGDHYNKNKSPDIEAYLEQQEFEYKTNESHCMLRECPFCLRPTNNDPTNLYKLYIEKETGIFFCHRCGKSGSWQTFCGYVSGETEIPSQTGSLTSTKKSNVQQPLSMPDQLLHSFCITNLLDVPKSEATTSSSSIHPLDYLTNVRGLSRAVLRKYGVGTLKHYFRDKDNKSNKSESHHEDADEGKNGNTDKNDDTSGHSVDCISFPWLVTADEIIAQERSRGVTTDISPGSKFWTRRIKIRSIENKSWQRLLPVGGGWGLFGYHTIPNDAKEIVVTEGEYDAMAVNQVTGIPAVSLPNGCRSLPEEVLPLLERFSKIYLWMDNDEPGIEGSMKIAQRLGLHRCFIVRPTCHPAPKDANEALLQGFDMKKLIEEAERIRHTHVVGFKSLRDEVLHQILNPKMYVGVSSTSLPALTKIVKGFREGELSILTGPTGSGKTTLLSQLSLDFAEQGIPTLWGSFEIKNTILIKKMLQQFSKGPLPTSNLEELVKIANDFEELPLHFLTFHGGSDIDEVLEAVHYAIHVYGVKHIILDNLQFMISRRNLQTPFDKFDVQDVAVEKFRQVATDMNVHVTLVVHPRKEAEGNRLGISSIFGSAKVTQEADLILILQNEGSKKFLEVKKNRYDGTLGSCNLHFDPLSCRYVDDVSRLTSNSKNQSRPNF